MATAVLAAFVVSGSLAGLAVTGSSLGRPALEAPLFELPHARVVPALLSVPPNPFATGMRAAKIIGQPNFTANVTGPGTASQLSSNVSGLAFGSNGTAWVVDRNNSRILAFAPPFVVGEGASLVLGQPNFVGTVGGTNATSLDFPNATAFDARGDLWVSDSGNNRVLEFLPPFHDGMKASLVLGQPNFTARTPGTTASTFDDPAGLAFTASGALFVADRFNNRVLEFVPPFTDAMAASLVLGQKSFTSASVGPVNQSNLEGPNGLAVGPDGGLWVTAISQDRTLEYLPPFSDAESASIVLGEVGFTTTTEPLPNGQYDPTGVAVGPQGDVWVSDGGVNRVTEYVPPYSINETPAVVVGQANLTWGGCPTAPSSSRVCGVGSVALDPEGNLWVGDSVYSRVLEFSPESFHWAFSEVGLASGTTWSVTVGSTTLSNTTTGSSGTIVFSVWNGSYTYSVGAVSGYATTGGSGSRMVNATSIATTVTFSPTIAGLPPLEFGLLVGILVVAVGAAAGVLIVQRGRSRRTAGPPPLQRSTTPPSSQGPGEPPSVPPGAS
jgi:sugar lactone lactonase YvrE